MTPLRNRTIEVRRLHVSSVGSELARILRISRTVIADSASINRAYFAVQFARVCHLDELWRDSLEVLSEQALDEHVKDKHQYAGIDEELDMPENESTSKSCITGPNDDDICRMIQGDHVED